MTRLTKFALKKPLVGRKSYERSDGHRLTIAKDNDGSPYWEHTSPSGEKQMGGGLETLSSHLKAP